MHATTWINLKVITLSKRKPPKSKLLYDELLYIKIYRKCKLIYDDRRQISGCLGMRRQRERQGKITKGHNKTSGSDGYIHYLDCDDNLMSI